MNATTMRRRIVIPYYLSSAKLPEVVGITFLASRKRIQEYIHMTMLFDLKDDDLANYLADHLSDYEFEMTVRKRVERIFSDAEGRHPEFNTSNFSCRFEYSWGDESSWFVAVGSSYKDRHSAEGQVLGITLRNCIHQWEEKKGNKLSLLLPAPKHGFEE